MTSEHEALDKIEIWELRSAYCRAIDREEYERYTDIFTEDVVVEYPRDSLEGREAVYEYWRDLVDYEESYHTVQMPEIVVDGDRATGMWYMLVFYVAPNLTQGYVMGTYEDEYERVDGDWKIAYLKTEVTYDTGGHHLWRE